MPGGVADPGVLLRYGIEGAPSELLSGGTINRVWRVDASPDVFVLKRYAPPADAAKVQCSIAVQEAAERSGVPVPEIVPNLASEKLTCYRRHSLRPDPFRIRTPARARQYPFEGGAAHG